MNGIPQLANLCCKSSSSVWRRMRWLERDDDRMTYCNESSHGFANEWNPSIHRWNDSTRLGTPSKLILPSFPFCFARMNFCFKSILIENLSRWPSIKGCSKGGSSSYGSNSGSDTISTPFTFQDPLQSSFSLGGDGSWSQTKKMKKLECILNSGIFLWWTVFMIFFELNGREKYICKKKWSQTFPILVITCDKLIFSSGVVVTIVVCLSPVR